MQCPQNIKQSRNQFSISSVQIQLILFRYINARYYSLNFCVFKTYLISVLKTNHNLYLI